MTTFYTLDVRYIETIALKGLENQLYEESTMNKKQNCLAGAVLICLSGLFGQAHAKDAQTMTRPAKAPAFPGSKISLSPLPVDIFLLKDQKPIVAFTTPCIQIERMTNGFPPILAFENFMFTVIGNVNESELLPIRLEPVCI
jgi:hypothetical protein